MKAMPLLKPVLEGLTGATMVGLTFTLGTEELALALAALTSLLGVAVWLVRLEGRVNLVVQDNKHKLEYLKSMDERIAKIADRLGVVE